MKHTKLDILIPQYKETDEVVKPLLDSLLVQQNVNFDDISVIICNDGSDVYLSDKLITSYPFNIFYYKEPHRGVSGTRNACLDHSNADYVMFCDADDMFYNACGLYIIFREFASGFDSLVSAFVEESRTPDKKEIVYINHDMDSTFVHGKVHRRQYLIDNNIRWNEKLTIHEDSYFNCLCQKLAKELKYCQSPFYLWKWRDDSVCRHDPKYILKTYNNMLDSNTALVNQFKQRKLDKEAQFYATSMIYDAYMTLNKDEWWATENADYKKAVEKRFKIYYEEFKDLFNAIDDMSRKQIYAGMKNRFFNEGMFMENITFADWIKYIETKV